MTPDNETERHQQLLGYAFAVVVTSIATLVRVLADTWTGSAYSLVLFVGAVAAATWYGGYRPGILAAVLSYVVANELFIASRSGAYVTADAVGLLLYALACAVTVALVERLRVAENRARKLAEIHAHALEGGDVVGWEWNEPARVVSLTENASRILGIPHRVIAPLRLLRHFAVPDRRVFLRALREAIDQRRLSAEVRFSRPSDGRTIWLRCQAQVMQDPGGGRAHLRGVFIDETPRLSAEAALRDAEARFRRSHDGSLRGYSLFTREHAPSGEIIDFAWAYTNPAAARLVKRRVGDLVGKTLLAMVPDVPARAELFSRMKAVAETGEAQDVAMYHEVRDIRGWFRHMIVPTDDGVALESFDITRTTVLEEELRRTADQLELANRRKNEFLALLAHELRTPLTPVRTAVEILSMRVTDPLLRAPIDIMDRQVSHITRLIGDLLDVARIEQGKIDLHRERVLVADVIHQGMELSHGSIASRGHSLRTEIEIPHVYIDVDPTRIAQVISNLLNNAAKFMSPGGRIWLTARKHGAMAEISVKDEGAGIAAEDLDRIFERFVQCSRRDSDRGAGLGLGLALVKNLVELHGGNVSVHSDGVGQGSDFRIQLPISIEMRHSPRAPPGAAAVEPHVERARILVADDDKDTVEVLAEALSASGMDVRKATDGDEALVIADGFLPEVMLIDLSMPGKDGYDIARCVRTRPWGATALLVALTGWTQDENKHKALSAGFDYHLTKPVNVRAILDIVALSDRWRRRPAMGGGA